MDEGTFLQLLGGLRRQASEVPYAQKPCFDKGKGIHGGAYKRVGDQDHLLSPYEIFLLQANRGTPKDDISIVPEHTVRKLDTKTNRRLKEYVEKVKDKSRSSYLLGLPYEELLEVRHIISDNCLTLMGMLAFDSYPQRIFPKLRITFLSFKSSKSTDNIQHRYIDNKVFEGTIGEILTSCLSYLKLNIPEYVSIENIHSRITSSIPEIALRECIINAIVHRDYSPMSINREIQIRLTPDKIEIENPGGLFGGMRVDSIMSHQSVSRNPYLATLLEDLQIIENRGDGIIAIVNSLKEASLPKPIFSNKIDSFQVTINRTPEASESAIDRRLPAAELTANTYQFLTEDEFFKKYPFFKRKNVIESFNMSEGEAKYFIKTKLTSGKIEKLGKGRGTKYKVIDS